MVPCMPTPITNTCEKALEVVGAAVLELVEVEFIEYIEHIWHMRAVDVERGGLSRDV